VFGKRAGEYAAQHARTVSPAKVDDGAVQRAIADVLAPFDRPSGENPFVVQHELQAMMQDLVGIVRREEEMQQALVKLEALKARAAGVGVVGHREYNSGWHTAIDLRNLLIVSEAITRAAIERKESRGGHFRDDYPDKDKTFGTLNIVLKQTAGGMQVERVPIPEMPAELKQLIAEQVG
jgi:succinate dehydrogenase / fumarate reductase flavoprotein subunit